MLVGNKLFSYPVLNKENSKSTYLNRAFEFKYDEEETDEQYFLKNIHFQSDSELLKTLYSEGKIKVKCVVECSQSIFRRSFEITDKPENDICLNKADVTEKVVISAFAYATDNIALESNEFIDDYQGVKYEIEKYDILAVDDGFSFFARKEEKEDNIVHSIFSIIPDHELKEEDGYEVNIKGKKITVSLNDKAFGNYKIIYTTPAYKEIFFGMILVHALEMALSAAIKMTKEEEKDVDDVCNKYRWFSSVVKSYLLREGKELTEEELNEYAGEKACILAQKLLGNPLNKALKNMVIETRPKGGYDNEQ